MAFDATPTSWIASISEDGTTLSFDLADLTEALTAAEADAVTGDWREIFWSIINHTFEYVAGLDTADSPTKLTIERKQDLLGSNTMLNTFTIKIETSYNDQAVSAEA